MRGWGDDFEQVVVPHAKSLLRFALRLRHDGSGAEDLVQETLLLAWRSFKGFTPGTNARAWLFRILINVFRGEERKRRSSPPTLVLTPGIRVVCDQHADGLEVLQALDRLAVEHRTVLLLAVVEGLTCREIAEVLGIPIGTVMSRLCRARETMRQALAPSVGEKVVR